MASEKQITANRKNAAKAGVRTEAGKAVSRMNALKHGMLSSQLLIEDEEDAELFAKMRKELFEECEPVGMVESMLVDKLFTTYWRLQRVPRAERAAIERSMTAQTMADDLEQIQSVLPYDHSVPLKERKSQRISLMYERMLYYAWIVSAYMQAHGLPLESWVMDAVKDEFRFGHRLSNLDRIVFANGAAESAQKAGKEDEVKEQTKEAMEAIKSVEKLIEIRLRCWRKWELQLDVKSVESKFVPDEKDAEKIQRYETHLHRMFMQTLHELQRVQALRLGRPAPLAAALDVTVNSDSGNGFIS